MGHCSDEQIEHFNIYMRDFLSDLRRTAKFSGIGEGGFLETCYEHCAEKYRYLRPMTIDETPLHQALEDWYQSNETISEARWHIPCEELDPSSGQCMPSCGIIPGLAD